ncbi:hypothetical protein DRE_04033 [Drechslerella stenobrocha 248]|uniref:NmrA-like domain-containing protein n=1 Tax=Drechslerella stenobrocha 248 TaxID=1043628 RepID=W7I3L0_9PEZI|nr:hypothetical protein DRE_04033 [Drechslerella stenobrocha 248]
MSDKNYIKNVAVVGATGRQGTHIVEELLKLGKHKVTAITRADSTAASSFPEGVVSAPVDYNNQASLVDALRGQDVLVITLAATAPPDTQKNLVDAAVEAGVRFVIPNEWGLDSERDPEFAKTNMVGARILKFREYIETTGLPYIGVQGGFWYEFSLGGSERRYGFDLFDRKYTMYDDGNARLSTSTWEHVSRAVGALLALKVNPDGPDDKSPTISSFYKKSVCVESFNLSQNEMFASLKRVTGTTDADWTITQEDVKERYSRGMQLLQSGDMKGFETALYASGFFPGNPASMTTLANELLGLPKEDLDTHTLKAIEYAKANPEFAH